MEQKQTNGNRIQYQYDAAGNISQQSYIAAGQDNVEQTVRYQYNANNQLIDVQQRRPDSRTGSEWQNARSVWLEARQRLGY
ncbi:hypothetical protein [Snodgrassella sp. ESL0253]|uniref:hypothetical protein n=1 Tax=Snodgrassella sp. ESL0253 TaxID=2705031 RepID=UPI00351B005F